MITLISPAKTLDFETEVPSAYTTEPIFISEPERLIKKLRAFSRKKIGALMSLSEKLADLNFQRYQMWVPEPSSDVVRQAVFMFKGEVYLGLDPYSFTDENIDFAQKNLRILSGLYGENTHF